MEAYEIVEPLTANASLFCKQVESCVTSRWEIT